MQNRASGILLHPTSLPGKYGIGTLGKEAYAFIDFLIKAKQTYWQILPLGPTGYADSPYQCFSSKAGNPFLIDFDLLIDEGLLEEKDIPELIVEDETKINYGAVIEHKYKVLQTAKDKFDTDNTDYKVFTDNNKSWLDEYALFMALKENFDKRPWYEWEDKYRSHDEKTLSKIKPELKDKIGFQKFIQYIFFKQWKQLKDYANNNGIKIIGDIPIYVAMDSSDTWVCPELFQFDKNKSPLFVGGCPPDYFSTTGQLWGNPIFNYAEMEKDDFSWWVDRIKYNLELYDLIRVDHFRGFAGYWNIPYGEETAINGEWIDGPGDKLFNAIKNVLGEIPIIAEDLGLITPDVIKLRDNFNLPGMKILQFAFDSGEVNDYIPHNYIKNCVVYTGTHDNETVNGWYENAKEADKEYILNYIHSSGENIAWDLIRCAWASVANTAIAPMQDLLNLGAEARMNLPGTTINNWQWRMQKGDLNDTITDKLASLTELYARNKK
ncbi:MAG: 4-alpha-glucanotransferase [Fimbriimonadaceae bacterium]|nr:4-alpha-glucanotransferase [Chitinophagales bacterium]